MSASDDSMLADIGRRLAGLRSVPSDVLADLVERDGVCLEVAVDEGPPRWLFDESSDRELAARLCAGCPVQLECLELELRMLGEQTVGVWGALGEDDRRALVPQWRQARTRSDTEPQREPAPERGDDGGGR